MSQVLADLIWRCVSIALAIGAPTIAMVLGFNAYQKRKVEEAKEKSVGAEALRKIVERINEIDERTEERYRIQEDRNEKFRIDIMKMILRIPE